jgi:hypothetical protein
VSPLCKKKALKTGMVGSLCHLSGGQGLSAPCLQQKELSTWAA